MLDSARMSAQAYKHRAVTSPLTSRRVIVDFHAHLYPRAFMEELARVGARRPRPIGSLTPAERRVAELAAGGASNKEIAQTLFISVHTVEAHLTHAYAKLGVRSRSQLAKHLTG